MRKILFDLVFALGLIGSLIACTQAVQPTPTSVTKPTETLTRPTEVMVKPTEVPVKPTEVVTKATDTPAKPTESAAAKPVWKQISAAAATAPAARYDHSLAFDTDHSRLILFGGRAAGKTFGDTWIFDLKTNAWREVKASGPPARFGHGAIYDPAQKSMFVFGGQASSFFNDTWAFETEKETWSEVKTSAARPTTRYGIGAVFDSTRERLIVSHGFTSEGRFDDTWALDLKTEEWTNLTPSGDKPLKRCLLDAVYDPVREVMYLFGGCASGFGPCPLGDLWMFDLKTNKWTEIKPSGALPGARDNPALVFDPKGHRAILFGGRAGDPTNDLWSFDPNAKMWTKLAATGPSARRSHDMIYDPTNDRFYMFGGTGESGASNELWVLEL